MKFYRFFFSIVISFVFVLHVFSLFAWGQESLEQRVRKLEKRIESMEGYLKNIKPALAELSQKILTSVDERFDSMQDKTIVLNPTSRKLYRLETNTGLLLLSIKKMKKVENGYILYLNVGNPNSATFSDLKMNLKWGVKWDPGAVSPTYQQWRSSLSGAEYTYSGKLEPGTWTDVVVDLSPAEHGNLEYIECKGEVSTVMLQQTPSRSR